MTIQFKQMIFLLFQIFEYDSIIADYFWIIPCRIFYDFEKASEMNTHLNTEYK